MSCACLKMRLAREDLWWWRREFAAADLQLQILIELLLESPATDDFVPVGMRNWGKRLGVCDEQIQQAVTSLLEFGFIKGDFDGERLRGVKLTVKGRVSAMESGTKPIMSQPDGRGKLYTRSGGGTFWEGTYEMPNGKMNRKRFRAEDTRCAKELYADWCRELSAEVRDEMREKVRPKAQKKAPDVSENAECEKGARQTTGESGKENEMGKDDTMDKIYTIQIVGGASIAWTESFDKAVAVCDALTLAAKASGFVAKYDVVEVKRWTA